MSINIKSAVHIFLYMALFSLLSFPGISAATDHQNIANKEVVKLKWSWRKTFKKVGLHNLAMAWNGSRLLFAVTEEMESAKHRKGDVIIALDQNGKPLNDWRAAGKINRLLLDGAGEKLLTELEEGSLILYQDLGNIVKTLEISPLGLLSTFSRANRFLVTQKDYHLRVVSPEGKDLWSYPFKEASVTGQNIKSGKSGRAKEMPFIIFPFIKENQQILSAFDSGTISLHDGEKLIWKKNIHGKPVNIASSFLEGGVIAVAKDNGELRFYNKDGLMTGSTFFQEGNISLSCSNIGNVCAAYGNGPLAQRVTLYRPNGKELWSYHLNKPSDIASDVVVAANGKVIIAGFKEQNKWSLRALDSKGRLIWFAPVEGGLAEFKVSWNGKHIAALTLDNRIVYYNIKDSKL